jgi:hypothetical protein
LELAWLCFRSSWRKAVAISLFTWGVWQASYANRCLGWGQPSLALCVAVHCMLGPICLVSWEPGVISQDVPCKKRQRTGSQQGLGSFFSRPFYIALLPSYRGHNYLRLNSSFKISLGIANSEKVLESIWGTLCVYL